MEYSSMLPSLLVLFLSLLPFYYVLRPKSRPRSKREQSTGGLVSYPLVGNLPQFVRNRGRLYDWFTELLASTPTNTCCIRRIGRQGVVTANPSNVEHILKNNFVNYPKGATFTSILRDFLGSGIFNSDGELWRAQRKTASLEFSTRSLRNFVVDVVREETVGRLLPILRRAARSGATVDLQDVLERFAFDNICRISFDVDPACLADESSELDGSATSRSIGSGFADAFRDAANLSAGRFRYAIPGFWKVKKFFGIGSERRLMESVATVHNFAMEIIRSRKREQQGLAASTTTSRRTHDDLLSRFIDNGDASDEYLRDIVISFILAGRDTTSSSFSWFFWLLSSHPHVVSCILSEIESVRAKHRSLGVTFGFDELKGMPYLHAAISESLRLYPPVPANSSRCHADDVLPDGTDVKEGSFASYNAYAMGRMEAIWGSDCMEYRPERWIDEKGAFRPESAFKYPVFHAGPRMCLGKEMAYIQMKSVAASVLERFEIEVVEKEKRPEIMLSLTLRMRRGLPVRVRARESSLGKMC